MGPGRAEGVAHAFAARADRADHLASGARDERTPLRFVAGLLRAQGEVAAALLSERASWSAADPLAGADARSILPLLKVARHAARSGPPALASVARELDEAEVASVAAGLARYRRGERATGDDARPRDYLARAMLRPLVELQRALTDEPSRSPPSGRCPFCAGAPSIAFRRTAAEGDGATRHLVCALCGLDWDFPRIRCPACGENDPEKLPAFHDERYAGVRLEACESCRRYVKSLDRSRDERIEPEVDDLASIALDLWAGERDHVRIEPGLAGL